LGDQDHRPSKPPPLPKGAKGSTAPPALPLHPGAPTEPTAAVPSKTEASSPPPMRPVMTTSPWGKPSSVVPSALERPDMPTQAHWVAKIQQDSFVELDPDLDTDSRDADSPDADSADEVAIDVVVNDGNAVAEAPIAPLQFGSTDEVEAFVADEAVSSEVIARPAHEPTSVQTFALESADLDSQERGAVGAGEVAMQASDMKLHAPIPEATLESLPDDGDVAASMNTDGAVDTKGASDSARPSQAPKRSSLRPPSVFDETKANLLREQMNYPALFQLHSEFGKRADTAEERVQHRLIAAEIAETSLSDIESALYEVLGSVEDAANEKVQDAVSRLLPLALQKTPQKLLEASRRIERNLKTMQAQDRAGARVVLARVASDLKRKDAAREHVSELGRLDPGHPLVLEQRANEARGAGDPQLQKTLLLESLQRFTRTEDRARIFLGLAELHEGPMNTPKRAVEYYLNALNEESPCLDALRGLERIARLSNETKKVIEMLLRQVEALPKGKEQYDARVRAAEEMEKI
jgi:hypothetical protein